jgi:transcription antitermination factor NusG
MSARWAVAVTELYKQEKVIEQLIARGLEYFFPQIRRTVRHRGRRIHRLDPLLFNYVPVVLGQGWEAIFDMRGVLDVMGPVHAYEIENIRCRCDASDILIPPPKESQFKPGQKVRPLEGPFADLTGSFIGLINENQETALFTILGAKRSLKFEVGSLVAA